MHLFFFFSKENFTKCASLNYLPTTRTDVLTEGAIFVNIYAKYVFAYYSYDTYKKTRPTVRIYT